VRLFDWLSLLLACLAGCPRCLLVWLAVPAACLFAVMFQLHDCDVLHFRFPFHCDDWGKGVKVVSPRIGVAWTVYGGAPSTDASDESLLDENTGKVPLIPRAVSSPFEPQLSLSRRTVAVGGFDAPPYFVTQLGMPVPGMRLAVLYLPAAWLPPNPNPFRLTQLLRCPLPLHTHTHAPDRAHIYAATRRKYGGQPAAKAVLVTAPPRNSVKARRATIESSACPHPQRLSNQHRNYGTGLGQWPITPATRMPQSLQVPARSTQYPLCHHPRFRNR